MSGAMLHGLGDCRPDLHCGCLNVTIEPDPVGIAWEVCYWQHMAITPPGRVWGWTMPDIAHELGLRVETVHGYRSRKQMPAPTGIVGRTPYWTDATIGPWIERQKMRRKHKGRA